MGVYAPDSDAGGDIDTLRQNGATPQEASTQIQPPETSESGLDIRSVAKKELSNQLSDIDSLSDEEINKRMQTLFSENRGDDGGVAKHVEVRDYASLRHKQKVLASNDMTLNEDDFAEMARIREKHLRTIEDTEIDQHNRQHCTTDSDGKPVPARPGSEC